MSDINMDIGIQAGADLNIDIDFQQGETPEINIETAPPGPKGDKGDPGVDGIPATHRWNGTTLTVTSASGTSSADLKGDKGDPGNPGLPGVGIESIDQTVVGLGGSAANTWEILLTDGRKEKLTLYNGGNGVPGKNGETPVRGVDYWTETDKEEIKTFAAEKAAEKVDDLRIGGRNYILGTGTPAIASNDGAAGKTQHLFLCKDAETADRLYGKTVVLSFDYKSTVSSGYASLNYNNTWQNIYRFRPGDTSGHMEIVTDLNAANAADGKFIYMQGTWAGDVTISNLKLEIGNKATDWTPALEDAPQGEGGAVTSVNGKTGAVELSAEDVGALPADTPIPTVPKDVSVFNNDAGYAKKSEIPNVSEFITRAVDDLTNYYTKSQTYTRDEINRKVSAIPKFSIEVVSSLPATGISETTVYLLATGSGSDLYTEYIYVNGTWEILGSQRVDLTGYATQTWTLEQLAGYQPKGNYALKSELPTVPTNVSAFQNDAGYAKKSEIPTIPTVPTKVSAFENDKGYLTQHQDISGKLDASRLPEAIDAALAQAKESGEFDGEDGYTPVKGTDYFTAVDIAELIEQIKTDCSWLDGYDIPKLYLTGDTTGISKDNAVTLTYTCTDASGVEHTGTCTLKWQGSSSVQTGQRLGGKMNFTIKLDTEIDVGYGEQKKYCLKANAIDHSHARNIVSARIWGMMAATRKSIIGNLASCPNYGAVNGFPCAIVLNDQFHGLYTWNIPKDDWMMSMGSGSRECILCADHSTATQFKGDATLVGETDFEIEYITDESNTAWAVTSVNRLINACINSNGSDLDTTIAQYLDWESAIDYYILVAMLDGQDMTDKNYILATYDGTKWFFSAYDMDSCYGLKWDASGFSKASNGTHTSFVNYANKHRLMELIKRFKTDALKARYAELRADVLSEATIAREFERFAGTIPSRLLDEDRNKWPLIPLTSVNNTFQILAWLNRRLAYMDKWMEELPAQEAPTGPSYTNQVPISTDASGNVFNGTGYMDGYRLNSSGTETAQEGSTAIGFIPCKGSDIIRIKGVEWETQANAGFRCYIAMYDSNKTKLVSVNRDPTTGWLTPVYDDATGVLTLDISGNSNAPSIAYVRFNFKGSGSNAIVTVNEEIA